MYEIVKLVLKTVAGMDVTVTIRGYERLENPHAVAEVDERKGELVSGIAYAVPSEKPQPQSWYKGLYELGASHYVRIDGIGDLPLDAGQAELLTTTFEDAKRRCQEHRRRADEKRTAEIRRIYDVKRVLRWSPTFTEYIVDAEYVLEEAYPANAAEGVLIPTWQTVPLREAEVKLDYRCPSLAPVIERSTFCGSMPGHQNVLFLISDEDWALLVAENDAIVEGRAAEMREHAARHDGASERLPAVDSPGDAAGDRTIVPEGDLRL